MTICTNRFVNTIGATLSWVKTWVNAQTQKIRTEKSQFPTRKTKEKVQKPTGFWTNFGCGGRTRWLTLRSKVIWLQPVFELVAAKCHRHLALKWVRVLSRVKNKHHPMGGVHFWRRTLIIIPQVLAAPHFAGGVHFSKYQNLHPSLCMYVFAYGIWLISP